MKKKTKKLKRSRPGVDPGFIASKATILPTKITGLYEKYKIS